MAGAGLSSVQSGRGECNIRVAKHGRRPGLADTKNCSLVLGGEEVKRAMKEEAK